MTVSRIRKEGISWIILFPIRLIRQLAGYSRIPARFSACNNKFSLDAALSTAHNWRQRGEGAVDGWSSPPKRPSSTTSVSPRLSISSHSLCTPWLHGPGAILGCVWIGTRGCACSPLHPLPPFSIYLSLPIHSRSRLHTRVHRYTLSLSLLRWSSVSVRRVGTSGASMIPSRSSQPMLALPASYNTAPTVYCSVRPFLRRVSGEEGNGLWAEGDPRNLAKLARRNYRYWATTYRHGISSVPTHPPSDPGEPRRENRADFTPGWLTLVVRVTLVLMGLVFRNFEGIVGWLIF